LVDGGPGGDREIGKFSLVIDKPSEKMLYIIGLGLSDERDITVNGLEVLSCI